MADILDHLYRPTPVILRTSTGHKRTREGQSPVARLGRVPLLQQLIVFNLHQRIESELTSGKLYSSGSPIISCWPCQPSQPLLHSSLASLYIKWAEHLLFSPALLPISRKKNVSPK